MSYREMAVVFTANDRPQYLAESLKSWSMVRGVEDMLLKFHCEPGCPEVVALCEDVDFAETQVIVNAVKLGSQRNTYQALASAFELAEYVVLAEDDMVVSTDLLELHDWGRQKYRDDRVLAVTAGRGQDAAEGGPAAVWRETVFGWMSGIWRDRWDLIGPDWTFGYEHDGWDRRLTDYWCLTRGFDTIMPAESRVQHIGVMGGTHMPAAEAENFMSRCFSPDYPPQPYYERGSRSGVSKNYQSYNP